MAFGSVAASQFEVAAADPNGLGFQVYEGDGQWSETANFHSVFESSLTEIRVQGPAGSAITIGTPDIVINLGVLQSRIQYAQDRYNETQESVDGTDIPVGEYWATETTLTEFRNAINAAEAVAQDPENQVQVDDAANALYTAIATFTAERQQGTYAPVAGLDAQALEELIDDAIDLRTNTVVASTSADAYEDEYWVNQTQHDDFSYAISAAQNAREAASTQSEINDAYDDLRAAYEAFDNARQQGDRVRPVDRTILITRIAYAENLVDNTIVGENNYDVYDEYGAVYWVTQAVMDALEEAIEDAIASSASDLQSVIDQAVVELEEAIEAFEDEMAVAYDETTPVTVDRTALVNRIADAQEYALETFVGSNDAAYAADYIYFVYSTSADAFEQAIEDAIASSNAEPADQDAIDDALEALEDAINDFLGARDLAMNPGLLALIAARMAVFNAINNVDRSADPLVYTQASIDAMNEAIDEAIDEANYAVASYDIDEVNDALVDFNNAVAAARVLLIPYYLDLYYKMVDVVNTIWNLGGNYGAASPVLTNRFTDLGLTVVPAVISIITNAIATQTEGQLGDIAYLFGPDAFHYDAATGNVYFGTDEIGPRAIPNPEAAQAPPMITINLYEALQAFVASVIDYDDQDDIEEALEDFLYDKGLEITDDAVVSSIVNAIYMFSTPSYLFDDPVYFHTDDNNGIEYVFFGTYAIGPVMLEVVDSANGAQASSAAFGQIVAAAAAVVLASSPSDSSPTDPGSSSPTDPAYVGIYKNVSHLEVGLHRIYLNGVFVGILEVLEDYVPSIPGTPSEPSTPDEPGPGTPTDPLAEARANLRGAIENVDRTADPAVYTAESIAAMNAAIDAAIEAAEIAYASTQTDVVVTALATFNTAVGDARALLVIYVPAPTIDTQELEDLIEDAIDLYNITVPSTDGDGVAFGTFWADPAAFDAFNSAIETAQAVASSPSDQDEVEDAIVALEEAIEDFEEARTLSQADLDFYALEAAISTATDLRDATTQSTNGLDVYEGDFWANPAAFAALVGYINAAIAARGASYQEDVDAAAEDLEDAIEIFEAARTTATVTRTELSNRVSDAQDYADETFAGSNDDAFEAGFEFFVAQVAMNAFNAAIENAESALEIDPTTQLAINNAYDALDNVITTFLGARAAVTTPGEPDPALAQAREALRNAINVADAIVADPAIYTAASIVLFEQAIANAIYAAEAAYLLEDAAAVNAAIGTLANAVNAARNLLVPRYFDVYDVIRAFVDAMWYGPQTSNLQIQMALMNRFNNDLGLNLETTFIARMAARIGPVTINQAGDRDSLFGPDAFYYNSVTGYVYFDGEPISPRVISNPNRSHLIARIAIAQEMAAETFVGSNDEAFEEGYEWFVAETAMNTFQTAIGNAIASSNTEPTTNAALNTAFNALGTAINSFSSARNEAVDPELLALIAARTALQYAIDNVDRSADPLVYTAESIDAMNAAIDDAIADAEIAYDSTVVSVVTGAIQILEDAVEDARALLVEIYVPVPPIDTAELDALIANANTLRTNTVPSEDGEGVPFGTFWADAAAFAAFDLAIDAANAVASSPSDQDEVEEAIIALRAAYDIFYAARTLSQADLYFYALEAAISAATDLRDATTQSANGFDVYEGIYWANPAAFAALADYINAAIAARGASYQEDVDAAVEDLENAIEIFEAARAAATVTRTELSNRVSDAEGYAEETFAGSNDAAFEAGYEFFVAQIAMNAFNAAIENAESALEIDPTTQLAINNAYDALDGAITTFLGARNAVTTPTDPGDDQELLQARSDLQAAIGGADRSADSLVHTAASIRAMNAAIDAAIAIAQAVLADDNAVVADVRNAIEAFNNAINVARALLVLIDDVYENFVGEVYDFITSTPTDFDPDLNWFSYYVLEADMDILARFLTSAALAGVMAFSVVPGAASSSPTEYQNVIVSHYSEGDTLDANPIAHEVSIRVHANREIEGLSATLTASANAIIQIVDAPESDEINSVTITGLVAPALGVAPVGVDALSAAPGNVTIESIVWERVEGGRTRSIGVFGSHYVAVITLSAADGFTFHENVAANFVGLTNYYAITSELNADRDELVITVVFEQLAADSSPTDPGTGQPTPPPVWGVGDLDIRMVYERGLPGAFQTRRMEIVCADGELVATRDLIGTYARVEVMRTGGFDPALDFGMNYTMVIPAASVIYLEFHTSTTGFNIRLMTRPEAGGPSAAWPVIMNEVTYLRERTQADASTGNGIERPMTPRVAN
jgi:hypothetical protein